MGNRFSSSELERQRLDFERQKLELDRETERQRLDLKRQKLELDKKRLESRKRTAAREAEFDGIVDVALWCICL
jgi:hypothetical protein